MQTSKIFEREIEYITDETIRQIVRDTLDAAPECIQTIPASSSGKYHPSYSLGDGGLMRHIKAAVGIAHSLIETNIFRNLLNISDWDYETKILYQDVAYAALILHDCKKPDDTPKHGTVFNHPLLAAELFKETAKKYITQDNMEYMKQIIPIIHNCIASHMGQWNTAPYAKGVVLPKPQKPIEHFVHLCDYLASRKFLIFDFNSYNNTKR